MGESYSRNDSHDASSAVSSENVPTDASVPGQVLPDMFSINVRVLSGEAVRIGDLTAKTSLALLITKVAQAFGREPHSVRLCLGSRTFSQEDSDSKGQTLASVGIEIGTEVTVLFRKLLLMHDLGVSRYNSEYQCTVNSIEEVAHNQLQIRFHVVGCSLGKLQDPLSSKLYEFVPSSSPGGAALNKSQFRLLTHHYDTCDINSSIEGALTYEVNDLQRKKQLYFQYGVSGYRDLCLNLEGEDAAG